MDGEKIGRFVELEKRKRELKAELSQVEEELKPLESDLLLDFERDGMQNCQVNGMTVYLRRQLWARPKDGDYKRACAALVEIGLGDMVEPKFNVNTLSSWIRERDREGIELPAPIREAIDVSEQFSIQARKAE